MSSTLPDLPPLNRDVGFSLYSSPNPVWNYGQPIGATPEGQHWMEGLKAGFTTFNATKEDPKRIYGLMISGIVPRPVAFVSTVSEDGTENLAPFSWFNQVAAYPPVISISCTRSVELTRIKDTVNHIKSSKGFVVNIISEPWVEQANVCAVDCPEGVSEWPMSGLTKEPSIYVKPPRVKESAFSMECEARLLQCIDIMDPEKGEILTATLILGSVKYIHVRNDVLNERGSIDPAKLQPVARMGSTLYARVTEGYNVPRHDWEKDGQEILKTTKENETVNSANKQ